MTVTTSYDVVITGGGIMGSSTAYHLVKMNPNLRVAVVERDPTYARASTTLSMSNVRIQFSLKENIQISQHAFVEWWSPAQVRERFHLYEPSGYAAATFSPDDGHFDAYAALMAYKAKARSLGAHHLTGEAVRIAVSSGRVQGVELDSGKTLQAACVVNCGGAWAAQLAESAGVKLPVVPVKRQIFALDTAVKPAGPLPLTVLPSGLYFRTETGGVILLGKSMAEDDVGFNFSWDENRFVEIL